MLAAVLLVSGWQKAEARPLYLLKAFQPNYPELKEPIKELKVKCDICHYGKEKKDRNNYGAALHEALGKDQKDIKDVEKLKAGLKKAEEMPSAVEGKTFGQLIHEGKLPNMGFTPPAGAAGN
jgi:hypothetical protein